MNNSPIIISVGLDADGHEESADVGPELEIRSLVFSDAQHGQRLDRALVALVPEFSRNYLQQLIELGGVCLNGRAVRKPSARIKSADHGSIELRPTPQSQSFQPQAIPLSIVYEDDHLMIIDKPAGLVVHPAPGNWSGTLLNGLLAYDTRAAEVPRAGIVHRLDKDTSGLMVVARTRAVMDALVQMIAARTVTRQYLAVGHRSWIGGKTRTIDAPIGRDPRNRLRMAVVDLATHQGKLARTDVAVLATCDQGCLVKCTLHTGRTHQIRVHLASIGHPLVSDETYGGALGAGMGRQALHAFRLAFEHPVTGESLEFFSNLPRDILAALSQWGLSYNADSRV